MPSRAAADAAVCAVPHGAVPCRAVWCRAVEDLLVHPPLARLADGPELVVRVVATWRAADATWLQIEITCVAVAAAAPPSHYSTRALFRTPLVLAQ